MAKKEYDGGFAIGTYHQDIIEENALEQFGPKYGDPIDRSKAIRAGYVNAQGAMTTRGWEQINKDILVLERNALAWMNKNFEGARDEGHDRHDDLVGSFWFDPFNPNQASLIQIGIADRIDMTDSSYGDLAHSVFKGVSPFGSAVLGGAINFFDIDPETLDKIEATVDKIPKRKRG